jgi:hypothetical protein
MTMVFEPSVFSRLTERRYDSVRRRRNGTG